MAPSSWKSSTQSSTPSAATPCTAKIWLKGVGAALNPKNGKLLHNKLERSGVDNIYAIGDVLGGKRELTPVAIQVGKRLARRLVRI